MSERIQKVLARAGYGSRRLVESWIKEGKLQVNGVPATLGDQITEKDRVTLEGRPLSSKRIWQQAMPQVLLYHKPVGEVCTRNDPEGRRTIFQSLPVPEEGRWVSVGRLDLNTSGLIILTTDGELANQLMHPSNEMDREYAVRVLGEVTSEMMQTLRDGVELEDGKAHFSDIQPGGGEGANTWFHVVIQEGRNREVRRLWESQGVQVSRLVRLRYGPVIMPNKLKPGRWMMLEGKDLEYLYEEAGLKTKAAKRGAPVDKIPAKKEVPVENEKAAKSSKWPDKSTKAATKPASRSAKRETPQTKKGPRIRGRSER